MTTKEELVSQHIREWESRMRHIDELYERAHKATEHLEDEHESRSELEGLAADREKVQQEAEDLKTLSIDHWREDTIQNAGPMAIWDILAQKLESFVERHE